MEEKRSSSPTAPPRRPVRARELPAPPPQWWLGLLVLVLLCGIWRVRAQPAAPGTIVDPASALAATGRADNGPPRLVPLDSARSGAAGEGAPISAPALEASDGTLLNGVEVYTVQPGDTLTTIADQHGVVLEDLMALNGLVDPNLLIVGQSLKLPNPALLMATAQRLLPDSEIVYSPAYREFDLAAVIREHGGLLATYEEEVAGQRLSGIEIVARVAEQYSVGPRPLLALLEYRSGWLTDPEPLQRSYPAGYEEPRLSGLFEQLSWAANRLNEGYYNQFLERQPVLRFSEGSVAALHPETNPGSAALQTLFSINATPDRWSSDLGGDGFAATYHALFGDPWERTIAPLVPDSLEAPPLTLPWPAGETWYFTGGPHGGWGDKSAWAALDFVPPDITGCAASTHFATAAAAGLVIQSRDGEVVIDLDGDGFAGTGWTLLYMHMATDGRAAVGTRLAVGDPVGRPSCEGGFSDAAHLHFARRYNGQWISSAGRIPIRLDGWDARSPGRSYDGQLLRGTEQREACACRVDDVNGLTARSP